MIRKSFPLFFLFICVIFSAAAVSANSEIAGEKVWQKVDDTDLRQRSAARTVVPDVYGTFRVNKSALNSVLNQAPDEFSGAARASEVILSLPLPDGGFSRFRIQETQIMEAPLAAKYADIKTYIGQGIDDPTATARISMIPAGFNAMILSDKGTINIDPYAVGDSENYISYDKSKVVRTGEFICEVGTSLTDVDDLQKNFLDFGQGNNLVSNGTTLRVYRLALAATAEYTNVFRQTGDTDADAKARALAQQVLIMNRVNGVYERDFAVRMVLVANNDLLIYTDAATDPYTNNSGSTMLGQNQTNITTVIGTANYDIGHVFSTGGGGVASLRVPCSATSKARGVTGLTNPVGDAFAIDYVAHEMGHQFGGNHTFNGSVGSCSGGNRSASAAFEPGSGITIMAYAGICGNQDLDAHSIDTFHVRSLEEIIAFINNTATGDSCSVKTATGNTIPTIAPVGAASYNIPKQTPFTLTAAASDADGDTVTYDWQEYDLGTAATTVPNSDTDAIRPIFRPYLPTTGGSRTFPSLQYILNNANVPPSTTGIYLTGEILPAVARTMNFQAIARDNKANGGGVNTTTVSVIVDANSGPFVVTSPNMATTVAGNSAQTVTWSVANTTAAPINAANVKISLSTDGGLTFPTVLAASTPNDGTESVTMPNRATTTARIKIEAVGNVFFDISDANFTITAAAPAAKRFDFDGDGKSDISVYRNGSWYLNRSQSGFAAVNFGLSTDRTVAADYDGDGKTDVAIFRNGLWAVQNSSTGTVTFFNWGQSGDTPMVGDYDGDGKADYTVFRNGTWYIQQSSTGTARYESFGNASDKPVVGNFDGDGKQDLAVFRNGTWFIQGSQAGFYAVSFGTTGDVAVPADYDGDGKTDVAVFRSGNWYIQGSTRGYSVVNFGIASDTPAPADYDGDGKTDVAVFRNGNWYLQNSQSGFSAVAFGQSGDKPVPAQSF